MPQFAEIRHFLAAAENGSFRQAAASLGVQQSSVSRAVLRLENELGVSLFERQNTGVILTDAGRRFLSEALPALKQLDHARHLANAAGRAEIGVVRVGLLTSLAGGFLRRLIATFQNRYPQILIDVRDGGREEHVAAIRVRELDIAFVTGAGTVQNCETAELWTERVHVALPKGHRLAKRRKLDWVDLRGEQFIVSRMAPGPEVHDYIVRRGADYSTYPEVLYKAVVWETLMNLVGLGQGITFVSAAWLDVKLPDLVLRPLTDPADIVPFSAIWSPRNDNPALRRFISVAHTLAGRVRRGTSDWSPEALGLAPIKSDFRRRAKARSIAIKR